MGRTKTLPRRRGSTSGVPAQFPFSDGGPASGPLSDSFPERGRRPRAGPAPRAPAGGGGLPRRELRHRSPLSHALRHHLPLRPPAPGLAFRGRGRHQPGVPGHGEGTGTLSRRGQAFRRLALRHRPEADSLLPAQAEPGAQPRGSRCRRRVGRPQRRARMPPPNSGSCGWASPEP